MELPYLSYLEKRLGTIALQPPTSGEGRLPPVVRKLVSTVYTKLIAIIFVAVASGAAARVPAAADEPDFNRDIRPILAEHCFACHGFDAAARQADLRLDQRDSAIDSGAIVPGDPTVSELVARITSSDLELRMPPAESGHALSAAQIEVLRLWIEQGARYEKHWAFVAPQPAPPPQVGAPHPIDEFVQSRLRQQGLSPSPVAEAVTLIRRVSLDLTGIPPSPAEVDAFVGAMASDPAAAYQQLVDRLLADPRYGERWGRWWLDQARYADSNGYSIDAPRSIWKYRDWVVAALNADMPFDTFTIEQLAGDLLPHATQSQKVATGFHRNTQINQEGGIDKEQFRIDSIFDRVATTGTVWLGLSIGCAQCHDHKFDPISQREYYRFFAFFNDQSEPSIPVYEFDVDAVHQQRNRARQKVEEVLDRHAGELKAWESELGESDKASLSSTAKRALKTEAKKRTLQQRRILLLASGIEPGNEFATAYQQFVKSDRRIRSAPRTLVLRQLDQPRQTRMLVKGDFTRPAEEVSPGTPAVLHSLEAAGARLDRWDLARWLIRDDNPLTARVIVNRIWQQYFGRGLNEVENDFGLQGSVPSHPGLLDWLAIELVRGGWSLKSMHRLIVTSHTYRQSSVLREELREADPENYLLARQKRLRLDAEIVRDAALSASGLLTSQIGGLPVFPPIPDGVMNQGQVKRAWQTSRGGDRYRRGLYTFKFRATPPPALNVFDSPDGFSSCTRRVRSNTPLQALTLMNDPAHVEFAAAMQSMVEQQGVEFAFRRCTGRRPSQQELAVLTRLDSLTAARVLLNLDETITRE